MGGEVMAEEIKWDEIDPRDGYEVVCCCGCEFESLAARLPTTKEFITQIDCPQCGCNNKATHAVNRDTSIDICHREELVEGIDYAIGDEVEL